MLAFFPLEGRTLASYIVIYRKQSLSNSSSLLISHGRVFQRSYDAVRCKGDCNSNNIILITVNYFPLKRKISRSLEASAASGVCNSSKTESPSSSLARFHRAICPRCLVDRLAPSQCCYLRTRQCSKSRYVISYITNSSGTNTTITFLKMLR